MRFLRWDTVLTVFLIGAMIGAPVGIGVGTETGSSPASTTAHPGNPVPHPITSTIGPVDGGSESASSPPDTKASIDGSIDLDSRYGSAVGQSSPNALRVVWNRTLRSDDATTDWLFDVAPTADGGAVAVGQASFPSGDEDAWLVKFDATGTVEFQQFYGGSEADRANSVVRTDDGGFAVVGSTESFGAESRDLWLLRVGPRGTERFNVSYGGPGRDSGASIVQTGDGGFAITGQFDPPGARFDAWLLRTGPQGTVRVNETYGGSEADRGESLIRTADGGFAIVGETTSFGNGSFDAWLVRTDPEGTVLHQTTYGGDDTDSADAVVQTDDGGFAIAGYTESYSAGKRDAWLIGTGPNGSQRYSRTYGGERNDRAKAIVSRPNGGFAVAGWTASFEGNGFDGWVFRVDESGRSIGDRTLGGPGADILFDVERTDDGNLTIAGNLASDAGWVVELSDVADTVPNGCPVDVTGDGSPATDPDGDGQCEDVTGDGTFDIVDVAVFLDRFDSTAVENATAEFDFDGSGDVNVIDVATLLDEL